jgi:hypothetical protein
MINKQDAIRGTAYIQRREGDGENSFTKFAPKILNKPIAS